MKAAAAAIEDLNVNVARRAVETAVQIAPQRTDVIDLQSRTATLPELQALLEQGDDLVAARTLYGGSLSQP